MLTEYSVENFSDSSPLALLVMRRSIWDRSVRDFLLPDCYYRKYSSFREMTGGKESFTVETVHSILNSSGNVEIPTGANQAARRLCDAADFRELCRIFGERHAAVSEFELRSEFTFICRDSGKNASENAGNVLSYMRIEITCRRIYEADVTALCELVRYRGGDNFDLYWDSFPDIDRMFTDGRAKGCNVFMRGLGIYDIQSDGVPDDVRFGAILPVVIAFSRIAVSQFDYIIPLDERTGEMPSDSGKRCIWADPEGRIRYTKSSEGLEVWGIRGDDIQSGEVSLMHSVMTAVPGETLIAPKILCSKRCETFLEMQKTVYKKAVHL